MSWMPPSERPCLVFPPTTSFQIMKYAAGHLIVNTIDWQVPVEKGPLTSKRTRQESCVLPEAAGGPL